jgi:site-specific recombinase XerD
VSPRWGPPWTLQSVLAPGIRQYIAAKRAAGCRFLTEERSLRPFDRFLTEQGVASLDGITPELIDAFMASRRRTSAVAYNDLLRLLRRLFGWLMVQGLTDHCPVRMTLRRATAYRVPFIFDADQARRLLEAAASLPDGSRSPQRGRTYRSIFAILYGLGLRVGEVSRLLVGDIDWEKRTLLVRDSKFGKTRLVPFGPRLGEVLRDYLDAREQRWGPPSAADPLFTFDGRGPISTNTIRNTFQGHIMPRLQLPSREGTTRPRVHDLRHSFAVGVLLRWYRTGMDPAARLHYLSTFLGHSRPESTAVYLTITADLLQEANRRFERFARRPWSLP